MIFVLREPGPPGEQPGSLYCLRGHPPRLGKLAASARSARAQSAPALLGPAHVGRGPAGVEPDRGAEAVRPRGSRSGDRGASAASRRGRRKLRRHLRRPAVPRGGGGGGPRGDKRRREFTTARACARPSSGLGCPRRRSGAAGAGAGLAVRDGGQHHALRGYRGAAVARGRESSIGMDAEPNEAIPGDVLRSSLERRRAGLDDRLMATHRKSAGTGCCSARRSRCTRRGIR